MPFNTEKPELKCYKGYILQPCLSICKKCRFSLKRLTNNCMWLTWSLCMGILYLRITLSKSQIATASVLPETSTIPVKQTGECVVW